MHSIIPKETFRISSNACRFQGKEHGDVPFSFFWLNTVPGAGPALHVHPYEEVFIVQHGRVTFTVGEKQLEVEGGNVVIAPANTPHKFRNSGNEPLEMVSIHPSKEVIQTMLEE
jgi:mannose-6-phosphate isomerase-like protein (cupin superfamily)